MWDYPERKTTVTVRPWLKEPDPGRGFRICGVTAHSSRGPTTMENQGIAVENWMANNANGSPSQGWGSSCDLVVFSNGERRIMLDWDRERPLYGAGYGDAGSWDMGAIHIQVEIAQPDNNTPFTPESIESFAEFCAAAARKYKFPLVRLPFLTQTEQPFPRGISSHDAIMNGRKYGKTDVGKMFPWAGFLVTAQRYYDEDDMAEYVTKAEFEEFKRITTERYVDDHKWLIELDAELKATNKRMQTMDKIDSHWRQNHEQGHEPPVLP